MTQEGSADERAGAAQRRADEAGVNIRRNRELLRALAPDGELSAAQERAWIGASAAQGGLTEVRDRAARMHDSAADLHDEAARLGIGDGDAHRSSAARHREAAVSHRPGEPVGEG